jgi:hypothetical protein
LKDVHGEFEGTKQQVKEVTAKTNQVLECGNKEEKELHNSMALVKTS